MKTITRLFLLIAGTFVFSFYLSAQTINANWKDGVIYFKLTDNVTVNNLNNATQGARRQQLPFLEAIENRFEIENISQPFFSPQSDVLQRTFRLNFSDNKDVHAILKELRNSADVEYAEPMPLFRTFSTPNDTYYNTTLSNVTYTVSPSWHLDLINAEQAWNITPGNPNIVVAVIDNAIWTDHPDLQNKVIRKIDLADKDENTNPPTMNNAWAHGTHVAGLIAAETNNNLGVASIGNNISLMAIKVTKNQTSNPRDLDVPLEAIIWAADSGAHVINMSFGSPDFSQTLQNIANYAYNKGCVLVAAAGNSNKDEKNYPAALNHVIAVGSCDGNNAKSNTSNYGNWIDLLAPGGYATDTNTSITTSFSVLSTYCGPSNVSAYQVAENYGTMNGTSMSSPIVAGLCGLMLSVNPHLTPEKLTDILKYTCENVDNVNAEYIGKIGAGRINARESVWEAQNMLTPLVANFSASSIDILAGSYITFTDRSFGSPTTWAWEFEGGKPAISTEQNPVVRYYHPGTYQVKLTVTDNASNTDIEIKTAYIIVRNGNWIKQNTNFSMLYRGVLDINIVDENTVWILTFEELDDIGMEGTRDIAVTTDGGNTWIPHTIDIGEYIPASISAVSAAKAWIVAYHEIDDGSAIFNTSDGGQTWIRQATTAFSNANSFANVIHMFNENEGFCQGDPITGKFEIYTTQNGGATWNLIPDANSPSTLANEYGWTGCVAAYSNNAWFGTSRGRVFRTTDKGQTWQAYDTPAIDVTSISFADADNGVALCYRASNWKMLNTDNGGETWQEVVIAPTIPIFSAISAVPGTPGMYVGIRQDEVSPQYQHSRYSLNYGQTWTTIDQYIPYTTVKMFNKDTGWAGGFNSKIENGGGIYKWSQAISSLTFTSGRTEEKVKIYPNPATNVIHILNAEGTRYEIIDLMGRIILTGKQNEIEQSVDISNLQKGCFFIKIYKSEKTHSVLKFIKL